MSMRIRILVLCVVICVLVVTDSLRTEAGDILRNENQLACAFDPLSNPFSGVGFLAAKQPNSPPGRGKRWIKRVRNYTLRNLCNMYVN